jgi:hypothetical protein
MKKPIATMDGTTDLAVQTPLTRHTRAVSTEWLLRRWQRFVAARLHAARLSTVMKRDARSRFGRCAENDERVDVGARAGRGGVLGREDPQLDCVAARR